MAKIEVLSGDFLQGAGEYRHGTFRLKTVFNSNGVEVKASAFKTLEIASESPITNKDALGYGIAGAMLLGPVGALAGYLMAGTENEVTFIGTLKDGRQLMAATDSATYKDISQHLLH
ncbi:hypothetical protein D3X12_21890 [Pseudomonas protegens]|jgi:hypothetical protein|uniref:Uncharacterized protein n=4 Tax=Pseudomonas TaxID=286 RepID=Q4KBD1_PSEF5|nr:MULTISPECIES: hypothetical protein [Pseudomonas]GED73420.1 hypothetical protein PFL02_02700 [Pseudomonas fluorescens]AAY92616.1 conserved hypothetical protein [Pseudomonas protegens Pf-5]AGL85148.1 hypothetical protein PFLCHA0_c33780 [Pseudomonas protegens CHA0]AQT10227.1 hypothetical protein H78_03562 [Pseudomonas protegens]ASE23197.1 hypothetical protein CEP86_23005 [Pseudomonas protegens]